MLELVLAGPDRASTVLLLGAHCDDIEIGCGATIRALALRRPLARFVWVTFSADARRGAETRSAIDRLFDGVEKPIVHLFDFEASFFPDVWSRVKRTFESLKSAIRPDVVFTHCRDDLHQDHRIVSELTWNTFRDHLILEYEIPKFDGDLRAPNVFVPIERAQLDEKIDILMSCFPSQRERQWFTPSTFEAIARIRGVECNAPGGYAEAFHGRKLPLAF